MFEKSFASVISKHPQRAEVSYKGASALGIFEQTVNKLFTEDGSSVYDQAFTLTYITSTLPTVDNKKTVFISINSKSYRILNSITESLFITTLNLEEKK